MRSFAKYTMRFHELIVEYAKPNASWFAGSKVVDDNDQPLVVYHGSLAQFAKFEHGRKNGMTNPRKGFYFTDYLNAAREFGHVHAYYLAIKHPADFRDDDGQETLDHALASDLEWKQKITASVESRYGSGGNTVHRVLRLGLLQQDRTIDAFMRIGCDGLFFEDDFAGHSFTSYVAFAATQIRRISRKPVAREADY